MKLREHIETPVSHFSNVFFWQVLLRVHIHLLCTFPSQVLPVSFWLVEFLSNLCCHHFIQAQFFSLIECCCSGKVNRLLATTRTSMPKERTMINDHNTWKLYAAGVDAAQGYLESTVNIRTRKCDGHWFTVYAKSKKSILGASATMWHGAPTIQTWALNLAKYSPSQ
jgi:hypothetical protein